MLLAAANHTICNCLTCHICVASHGLLTALANGATERQCFLWYHMRYNAWRMYLKHACTMQIVEIMWLRISVTACSMSGPLKHKTHLASFLHFCTDPCQACLLIQCIYDLFILPCLWHMHEVMGCHEHAVSLCLSLCSQLSAVKLVNHVHLKVDGCTIAGHVHQGDSAQ